MTLSAVARAVARATMKGSRSNPQAQRAAKRSQYNSAMLTVGAVYDRPYVPRGNPRF